jgi:hypothetical protein
MTEISRLNAQIQQKLRRLTGVSKLTSRDPTRKFSEPPRRTHQVGAFARQPNKYQPLPPLAARGAVPVRSADDLVTFIEDLSGRLSIPLKTVTKVLADYDASSEVREGVKQRDPSQLKADLQHLSDFVSLPTRRKLKQTHYGKRYSIDNRGLHYSELESPRVLHITEKYSPLFSHDLESRYIGRISPYRNASRKDVDDMLQCWNETGTVSPSSMWMRTLPRLNERTEA